MGAEKTKEIIEPNCLVEPNLKKRILMIEPSPNGKYLAIG
jgi:hypothetical protein